MFESPSIKMLFINIARRQLVLSFTNRAGLVVVMSFFLLVISIFRIAGGEISQQAALSIIFSAVILALMLSADDIILTDYKNGILEQLCLLTYIPEVIFIAKALIHSAVYCFGFILVSPIAFIFLGVMDSIEYGKFFICLTVVIFVSTLVIMFTSSLILDARKNFLLPLLSIPILLPSLIFSMLSLENDSYLFLVYALLLIAFPVFILATSYSIAATIENE